MSRPPPSLGEKFAQATFLWLIVTFFSVPLWEAANIIFDDFQFGRFHSLIRHFLNPVETILVAMILVGFRALEFGHAAFVSRYWPAVVIASAFTALFLRWWWRRSCS